MQQRLSYSDRITLTDQVAAQTLFTIMEKKQTNLIVAADVRTKARLLELADQVGPFICALKTHIDCIDDFDGDLKEQLTALANKHHFLLFEDRKFSDIGNTTAHQCIGGTHHIAHWADMVTAHTISGPNIIRGLQVAGTESMGIVLVAQMSSKGNLITPEYTQKTIGMADNCPESVIGFICQEGLSNNPAHIHMTPRIKFNEETNELGQDYITPKDAIKNGTDCIIVGRAIWQANNPAKIANAYKQAGWNAYLESINN